MNSFSPVAHDDRMSVKTAHVNVATRAKAIAREDRAKALARGGKIWLIANGKRPKPT